MPILPCVSIPEGPIPRYSFSEFGNLSIGQNEGLFSTKLRAVRAKIAWLGSSDDLGH